jgi:hypothetical protein
MIIGVPCQTVSVGNIYIQAHFRTHSALYCLSFSSVESSNEKNCAQENRSLRRLNRFVNKVAFCEPFIVDGQLSAFPEAFSEMCESTPLRRPTSHYRPSIRPGANRHDRPIFESSM